MFENVPTEREEFELASVNPIDVFPGTEVALKIGALVDIAPERVATGAVPLLTATV